MTVRIDPEFRALIAPLRDDEKEQLEANLKANGCRDPLVTWRGILIDGHSRYEICTRLKLAWRSVEMALASREHILLWIEENQLGRRNLTGDQRAMIADAILERRAKLAMSERGKKGRARGGDATPEQNRDRLGGHCDLQALWKAGPFASRCGESGQGVGAEIAPRARHQDQSSRNDSGHPCR
jgi:hypothetical protein